MLRKDSSVAAQIQHSITSAPCVSAFKHFRLTAQHRCQDAELFAAIEKIGDGEWPTVSGESHDEQPAQRVRLPRNLFPAYEATDENVEMLRTWVHGDPNNRAPDAALQGAIVTSTVASAKEHNAAMLALLDGEHHPRDSIDRVVPVRDGTQPFETRIITPETAKTFPGSGILPPDLALKARAQWLFAAHCRINVMLARLDCTLHGPRGIRTTHARVDALVVCRWARWCGSWPSSTATTALSTACSRQ